MPGKNSARAAQRRTHHRTKGDKKPGKTPQPERVKRVAALPKNERDPWWQRVDRHPL